LSKIAEMHGVDRSAVATAWIMTHPAKICPIIGTNNLDRISKIADAMKVKMNKELWFELYIAAHQAKKEKWRLP